MLSPSLLDAKFVVLLCLLGLARYLCPPRHLITLGALGSAILVGLAAPTTLMVISGVALLYLYPLHRAMKMRGTTGQVAEHSSVWLGVGIAGLVGALFLFKLYRHFTVPGRIFSNA